MRKKEKRIILVGTAVLLIGAIIGYNYYIDQIKIKGGIFGDRLKTIQDDLTEIQRDFASTITIYQEGDLNKEDFAVASELHLENMRKLVDRYNELDPPEPFVSSVELFRLSSQAQLERDEQNILWIMTGNESYNIRADELTQEAFSYELAALADYKAAQRGDAP